jgi:hypothetical protein
MKKIGIIAPLALAVLVSGCSTMPRYSNTQKRTFPNQVTYGYSFPDSSLQYVIIDGIKYDQGMVFDGATINWEKYKADKTEKLIQRTELVEKKEKSFLEKLFDLF